MIFRFSVLTTVTTPGLLIEMFILMPTTFSIASARSWLDLRARKPAATESFEKRSASVSPLTASTEAAESCTQATLLCLPTASRIFSHTFVMSAVIIRSMPVMGYLSSEDRATGFSRCFVTSSRRRSTFASRLPASAGPPRLVSPKYRHIAFPLGSSIGTQLTCSDKRLISSYSVHVARGSS